MEVLSILPSLSDDLLVNNEISTLFPSSNDEPLGNDTGVNLSHDFPALQEHRNSMLSRLTSDAWCKKEDPHLSSEMTLPEDPIDNVFDSEREMQLLFSHLSLDQYQMSVPLVQNKEDNSIISSTDPYHIFLSSPSSSSTPPPTQASTPPPTPLPKRSHHVITKVRDEDVLLGRGGLTNSHRGNISFRAFVDDVKSMYNSYKTKAKKKEISLLVVEHIEQKGGRFLKNIKKSSDSPDKWVVAERAEARKKASQALREKRKPKAKPKK